MPGPVLVELVDKDHAERLQQPARAGVGRLGDGDDRTAVGHL